MAHIPSMDGRVFAAIVFVLSLATGTANAQNPLARARPVSPPDCVPPENILVEDHPAPRGETYLRVRHIGDPGTMEWRQQTAHPVTWKVGAMTGLHVPQEAQRGFRDDPPPVGASAFQLWCNAAGIYINSWQFSHRWPVAGGGPNASVARDFETPPAIFAGNASIMIEGNVRLPWLDNQRSDIVTEGTAQLAFWYYAQDSTTGIAIAHVIHIFDNRKAGVNGSGVEGLAWDTQVNFAMSPLAAADARGMPVRFVTYVDGPAIQFEQPWSDERHFTALVTPDNFRALLAALRGYADPRLSAEPGDYRILSFGLLVEIIPGTDDTHNVSVGASVTDLSLSEVPFPHGAPRRFSSSD